MPSQVVALWSLLEACRARGGQEDLEAAAVAAQSAIRRDRHRGTASPLCSDEAPADVEQHAAAGGSEVATATHGLSGYLRRAEVARVQFDPDVQSESLLRWALLVVDGAMPRRWPDGVHVEMRGSRAPVDEPVELLGRAQANGAQQDSRLRSVFLQHRLIAGLPSMAGVDPTTAKLVVQGVVDRLLQVAGGLEPLMLLQQDEVLLQRSTTVAVLTVLFARHAGWPTERLADLGVAGLLHDLGAVLDPDEPGPAAFHWLLQRGADDFWLRSALVARRWRSGVSTPVAASDDESLSVVALVRLAVAAAAAGPSVAEAGSRIAGTVSFGGAPTELGDLAGDALISR